MPNSSDTFKTGERVLFSGDYECLICKSMGKATVLTLEEQKIFPFCPGCETKDCTYHMVSRPARPVRR